MSRCSGVKRIVSQSIDSNEQYKSYSYHVVSRGNLVIVIAHIKQLTKFICIVAFRAELDTE